MDKITNTQFCEFCKKLRINHLDYNIYNIIIKTNQGFSNVGLLHIIPKLDKYLFSKGIRLSPTQIILLRPDIFLVFLQLEYPDKGVINWGLESIDICDECYKTYALEIPDK